MSLLVALPSTNGLVLASDAHLKRGQVIERRSRIHPFNKRVCWFATGEQALIEKVAESFKSFEQSAQPLSSVVTPIGNAIKSGVKDFLGMDFRTEIYVNNLNAITQLHRADFVFAELSPIPKVLHMNSTGSPEWIENRPFLIGPGDAFASAILRRYHDIQLDLQLATVLAFRMMKEVIESELYPVKDPIELWQMTEEGSRKLNDIELKEIEEKVEAIRRHELAVFEKHLTVTVSH